MALGHLKVTQCIGVAGQALVKRFGDALAIFAAATEGRAFGENLGVVLIVAARPVVEAIPAVALAISTAVAARVLLPVPTAFGARTPLIVVAMRTIEFGTIATPFP